MKITIWQGLRCTLLVGLGLLGYFSAGNDLAIAQEPGQGQKATVSIEAGEWKVLATSPGVKIVKEALSHPGDVLSGESPLDKAYNWLERTGYIQGRQMKDGKLLMISVGAADVNAPPDHAKFIDSRYLAFQRAEMEAKINMALNLGVWLTSSRDASDKEISPEERGQLEEIVKSSASFQKNAGRMGIKDSIYRLFSKGEQLVEAKLDNALEKEGVDITREQREEEERRAATQARQDEMKRMGAMSETALKTAACAFQEIQGVQVMRSFEGSYRDSYQVVVIGIWSKNIQRMADSMRHGTAPSELFGKQAKALVIDQLPKDLGQLACLTGTKIAINERGECVLLAFGQSGVEVISREAKAYMRAEMKARSRARAAAQFFMGETFEFSSSEELRELLAEYRSAVQDGKGAEKYLCVDTFVQKVSSAAQKQKIVGLSSLATREFNHPLSGKPMVLEVMTWSPAARATAQEIEGMIKGRPASPSTGHPVNIQEERTRPREGFDSSLPADKDAF